MSSFAAAVDYVDAQPSSAVATATKLKVRLTCHLSLNAVTIKHSSTASIRPQRRALPLLPPLGRLSLTYKEERSGMPGRRVRRSMRRTRKSAMR